MKVLQILFFILALSIVGYCQDSILSGSIYDPYGALIPFAEIKAVSKDNKVYVTNANAEGAYELKLPADFYTIEFNSINFESVKLKNYRVINTFGRKMYLDISLNVVNDGTICELVVSSNENSDNKTKKSNKRKIKTNKQ